MQNTELLLKELTLEEKCALLSGAETFKTRGMPKHGIPQIWLSDGPHGLRKQAGESDHLGLNPSVPATCFPTASAVANSWDAALGEEIGAALGEEAAAQEVSVLLGPGLNMKRNPLCGRSFEYFSEDPYLAGKLAAGYIRGIQSKGVAACPKHFAVNSQETRRMASDSIVDERTLREIYLTGFEIAVKEGHPRSIMSSYNLVNGTYANENKHLLMEILRDEWGFDGAVITDWGGSNDHALGVKNGSTLEMPAPGGDSVRELLAAVESGKISESDIDARLSELLPLVFDTKAALDAAPREFDAAAHHALARRAAEETESRTLERIQSTVGYAQQHPAPPSNSGATGTIYRKKRNTVEFTPGQKIQTTPPPQPMPQHVGEPVGEPIETPRNQPAQPPVSTGFTMQMDALDAKPVDSTQEFMSAYNAVRRPRPAAQPAPAPRPAPAPQPKQPEPEEDAYDDTLVIGDQSREAIEETGERLLPHRQRDDVDTLVDTLTGRIKLTPVAPAPQPAPAQPAHTGFTQNLGTVQPVPARSAQAHSGYTQDLAGPAPAEPNTSAFVSDIANAINSEKEDTAQYAAAAARLTASLAEDAGATRTRARIPTAADVKKAAARLTGPAADEGDDNTVSPFDTAEIPVPHSREYERAEDAPAVRAELAKRLTRATIGCIAAGVAAAVMIVLAVLPARPAALNDATVYPAVMLVLLLAACTANWQTFLSGFKGLAKMPTPDSLAILPALGAAIQCIVLLATGGYTGTLPMMTGPAALVLCLNAVGRRLNAVTVSENFQLVSAKVEHSVAYRLKDAGALKAVSQGLAEPHPSVLVSRPTQIFRSFLTNSAAHGTSDKNQQQFAWALAACGAAAFLFTVISTKNAATAATAMAGVFCLAAPLAGTLLSALPARMMQRSAAQVGAVIPGWRDIRQLGRINVIQVTARDLFPAGCVTLAGIKPVKPEHIDTAIVYAASILSEAGPTLRDVFMNMLGENRSLLAKVDDRETVYGKGYVGWVNKRRVLVGNRALMQDYGIKIPSLEYEQHHTVNQRRVIYLAVSGKLFAMFQVAYQRDPDTAAVLETLHHNGLSLVVDCDDFNCDVKLLETAYSLPAGSVKVLSSAEHQAMAPAVAWLPESEGNMLHLGSFASFVGGLEAASGAAEGEHKSAIVLTVSVLLSCVVGVLLTLTGGLVTLPLPGIVLYQAAWCVLALIFPLLQRY